jgi:hypothetical protein
LTVLAPAGMASSLAPAFTIALLGLALLAAAEPTTLVNLKLAMRSLGPPCWL